MAYPRTGSTLGGTIKTGLSTQILVKVSGQLVGAIQSLTISQTRDLVRVKELGTDGILEIVPNKAAEYTIRVDRIVFDKQRLPEAFARAFINIKSQMIPFDIEIIDSTASKDGESGAIVHKMVNCWFNTYEPKYNADNFIISESATIWCEDIITVLNGTEKNAAGLNNIIDENTPEQEKDAHRRGTMDVPGIFQITKDIFTD